MIGRNPLLVAKEHGHRLTTMLTVYAAWAEGAVETDIAAIREAMNRTSRGTFISIGNPSRGDSSHAVSARQSWTRRPPPARSRNCR